MTTAVGRRALSRLAPAGLALALLLVACAAPGQKEGSDAGLDSAMRRFVQALAAQDTEAFAALFPQAGTWRYVSTIANPPLVAEHTGEELASDLAARRGLYGVFFEDFGLDTFRDHVTETGRRDWVAIAPNRFAPPRADPAAAKVYVEWRREEGRWVVSEIAEPAA